MWFRLNEEDQDGNRGEDQEDQEVDGPAFQDGTGSSSPSSPPFSIAESCESRIGEEENAVSCGSRTDGEVNSVPNPKTMSIVPPETIEVVAQTMGIADLSSDVAQALAPDVEYRLREIIQEAIKCMRHSKRTVLMTEDVDNALKLRNLEPLYGFSTGDPPKFKATTVHKDLFYIDNRGVDFKDVIESPLAKALPDTSIVTHWLAIEGVQPAIPENAPFDALVDQSENKKFEHGKDDAAPVDLQFSLKHDLSRDLQLYFHKITELIVNKYKSGLFKEVLKILATDSGLQPLVPYFSFFIANEVSRRLNNVPILVALMRVVRSLLRNPQLHIELYLHQLMPSMITCIIAKRLGNNGVADNHWELRDFSTNLVASVYTRYGHIYNLQSRILKTLIHSFLDPSKALTQHYGAIQGLAALGSSEVRLLILPNLETYLLLLEADMLPEKQKNVTKRREAWCVYGALMFAAGKCLYDLLKLFPGLLTPPNLSIWKRCGKIATTPNGKSSNHLEQQSPLKKITVDVSASSVPVMSMTSNMYSEAFGFSNSAPGEPKVRPCASSARLSTENISAGRRREMGSNRLLNPQSILSQAWKEDIDAGHLLAALFELFGEGIFSFMQPPEMNIFI